MENQKINKIDLKCSDWEYQWQLLMKNGNKMAQQQQWVAAAIFYKEAFELAENLLCNNCSVCHCDKSLLNTYLSSALEFGKAIRKNEYECALIALIEDLELKRTEASCDMEFNMYSTTINQLAL